MNLQLDRAIIIMDEAHNIENSCREAAAFQLTSDELAHVRAELHRAIVTPSEEGQWLSRVKQPLGVVDEVIALMSSWFEERRQYFDGGSEVVPEVDDLTTWASWKVNSRTFPALSAALRELTKVDKASGSRLPDRLVVKLNQFASTLRLVFGSNGMKLRDFRIVYKHTSDAKSDQLLILCLNPGVVFSPVAQASHSLILSSGTLSPLDSFASELGAPFDIQVSANHVIDPCQMCPMVLPALESGFRFSSAHSQLANSDYRSRLHTVLGETFERLLRVIPGGVLFCVTSHDFLRRLVEHWKFSRIYQAISEIKPIFVEKPGGGEELLARFKKSIESGRGGFLMGVCRGTTSEGMDFTDDQARAVFVFGIPYPNYADIDVQLKKAYNDRYAKGFSNRNLLSSHDWYDALAFRALAQAVGRCIRHKSDYGAVVLIDERFVNQSHNFPPWVRRGISTKSNLDDVASELRSFFAAMTQRFPVTLSTVIDVELPSSFNCAGCGAKILETYRFDPHQVYLVDRQGFLEIVESDHPMQVLAVPESSRKELLVPTPSDFWSTQDSICYKPIVCLCGTAVGTYLFAVSREDAQFLDSFWMIIERLTVSQGSNQRPISSIIVDACFDSVDDE
jgi:Fanconi anemia group J protein